MFAGSIPELYDRYLVPLIFEPYADDLVARLDQMDLESVLEVAAGTGVVTRRMASVLAASVAITATDLHQPMIDQAASVGTARPVKWQAADVMDLPFETECFDAVVCQFGAMFFPDRAAAFAEVERVLRPGGVFLFNVWDRIENNEFADVVARAVAEMFPADPPLFLVRTPHGYFDERTIRADLLSGGFERPAHFDTVEARSRAEQCTDPAIAFCHGTPMRNEIKARDPLALPAATAAAAAAIATRFGATDIDGRICAHVVTAFRR